MMETVHIYGIEAIKLLQDSFKDSSSTMLTLSHLGDPRNAFLVYFPLAYCLHRETGIQVLWLASVTEWLNAILKWVFHGHRPYWWVVSSGLYNTSTPVLHQYPLTCETGPGSPSGHAMVTASVAFCMVTAFLQHCRNSRTWRYAAWCMFAVFLLAVNVSRVFIATHFPHQVVFGTAAGIAITLASDRVAFTRAELRICSLIAMVMPVTCILTFYLFLWVGLDPQWSITMATEHCANKAWIHLDTTLFNAVYRDAGSILGMGIYHHFAPIFDDVDPAMSRSSSFPYFNRLVHVILSLFLCQLGENVKPVQSSAIFYYFFTFVKFSVLVIVVKTVTTLFKAKKSNAENFVNNFKDE